MSLFRAEALDYKSSSVWGEISVALPVSYSLISLLIAVFLIGLGFLVTFGSFSRTETVSGYLVPTNGLSEVIARRPGTVSRVMVVEGDFVNAGTPIAEIKVEQSDTHGQGIESRQITVLEANIESINKSYKYAEDKAKEKIKALKIDIDSTKKEIQHAEEVLVVQEQLTILVREGFNASRRLLETGYISKAEYEEKSQELLSQQATEALSRQVLSSRNFKLEKLEQELSTAPVVLEEEKRELLRVKSDLESKKIILEGNSAYVLLASVSGTLTALQVTTGMVVDEEHPLAIILPAGSQLSAELLIPSRAIGFIKPGQEVRLQYDAFPFQRFGSYLASVNAVSNTVLAPNQVIGPIYPSEPVYRASIMPESQYIRAYGEDVPLQAGMTFIAHILIERRTILEWIFDPVYRLRERV